ncbi:TPA: hypothetical protein NI586_006234, partial [Pseudomonas aeruginosa]|nr:hypothetical protein [Pseudomonas aeruginosa]HCL3093177.1 hypothetical protein [Pseudomonas aeruginosa 1BAE]HBO4494884.1 hypothetical protein [Pseudomonas aeruginosa]HCF9071480.1 hypothetical protein [Pseudomonas aeruginosa]HCF9078116.1 hypothetical protein [Pseudomonas aeruginosa]
TVFMESDAPRLYDSARSDQRYSEWIPTRPEGAGWFVLSIHDTDNGPVCQYVRPLGEHLSPIDLDAAAEQHERLLSEACAKALNQRDAALAEIKRNKLTIAAMNEVHAKLAADLEAVQARVAGLHRALKVIVDAAEHGSWPTTVLHGIDKARAMLAAAPSQAKPSTDDGQGGRP